MRGVPLGPVGGVDLGALPHERDEPGRDLAHSRDLLEVAPLALLRGDVGRLEIVHGGRVERLVEIAPGHRPFAGEAVSPQRPQRDDAALDLGDVEQDRLEHGPVVRPPDVLRHAGAGHLQDRLGIGDVEAQQARLEGVDGFGPVAQRHERERVAAVHHPRLLLREEPPLAVQDHLAGDELDLHAVEAREDVVDHPVERRVAGLDLGELRAGLALHLLEEGDGLLPDHREAGEGREVPADYGQGRQAVDQADGLALGLGLERRQVEHPHPGGEFREHRPAGAGVGGRHLRHEGVEVAVGGPLALGPEAVHGRAVEALHALHRSPHGLPVGIVERRDLEALVVAIGVGERREPGFRHGDGPRRSVVVLSHAVSASRGATGPGRGLPRESARSPRRG